MNKEEIEKALGELSEQDRIYILGLYCSRCGEKCFYCICVDNEV